MRKLFVALFIVVVVSNAAFAVKKQKQIIKVEVVATNTQDIKYINPGIIGAFQGVKTKNLVYSMNTIIEGEHTKLMCKEGHKGCTSMTPGVYDAEFDGKSLWITFELPLTHKSIREHWELSGGW